MATRKGFIYDTTTRAEPSSSTSPEASLYSNVVDDGLLVNGVFDSDVLGLTPSTTYYYRAFGYDETDYYYGEEVTFTTLSLSSSTASDRTGRKPVITLSGIMGVTGKAGNPGYRFDVANHSEVTFSTGLDVFYYAYWYKESSTWKWIYTDGVDVFVDNVVDNTFSDLLLFSGGVVSIKSSVANSVLSDFRVFHRPLTVAQRSFVFNSGDGTSESASQGVLVVSGDL